MNDTNALDEEWMTRQEVAKIFRVTPATVKRWEKDRLPPHKISAQTVRYKRKDVEALVQAGEGYTWVPTDLITDHSLSVEARVLLIFFYAHPELLHAPADEIKPEAKDRAEIESALAELKAKDRLWLRAREDETR